MISATGSSIHLKTASSSYVMRIQDDILEHVCYGPRIDDTGGLELVGELSRIIVSTVPILRDNFHRPIFPENQLLEVSTPSRGDYRSSSLELERNGCNLICDLRVVDVRVYGGKDHSFPANALDDEGVETCEIDLCDAVSGVSVTLRYTVYEAEDVILRSMRVENTGSEAFTIRKASSLLLDLPDSGYTLWSYDGAWGRERRETSHQLRTGRVEIESRLGCSGNEHNPLVVLEDDVLRAYGFNLIYSGNHLESAEVSPFGKTRVVTGISPHLFSWRLGRGESFETPEAVMTFSVNGKEGCSGNFQSFTRKYISRGYWKDRPRPILVNNWEATYMDFTQDRLLDLADKAAECGIELFVLDDGWFRPDDTQGLGDWIENRKRLPEGLKGLAEGIEARGLKFGLWVEPEMVNEDSDLYRAHPDWVVQDAGHEKLPCRHQYVLDLSRREVVDHLYTVLERLFGSCRLSYVKWDMNRTMSDVGVGMGEGFMHRYILGLYELLSWLTTRFPEILFEGCASGGNRCDLGMFCFFSQNWASDNTDLVDRVAIQEGTLMGYPSSTMGAHVSASPGHQSLRISRIDSRFNIAAFGLLGYELDLMALDEEDIGAIKSQVAFYKRYRDVFQHGIFRKRVVSSNQRFWYTTLGKVTIALEIQTLNEVHTGREDTLVVPWAGKGKRYRISVRKEHIPARMLGALAKSYGRTESEDYEVTVSGDILSTYGVALGPQFMGNVFFGETRILGDYGSRMYIVEEI